MASELPALKDVLGSTGKAVESFWEQFSAINCTETVCQSKLGKDGKVAYRRESAFDYLVMMRQVDDDIIVEESRLDLRPGPKREKAPMLVTNGFSTLLLIFHPHFQNSYEFSQPVEEELEGRRALRVDFRQLPHARSPSCLYLRGRDYPLQWSGTAWIEPQSWSLLKITASISASMEDLGLRTLHADVRYAPVRFSDVSGEQWLPSIATIEAETPLQHWKNTHSFTNYKHFAVKTSTKTETPK